jgi:hypothetical protein
VAEQLEPAGIQFLDFIGVKLAMTKPLQAGEYL